MESRPLIPDFTQTVSHTHDSNPHQKTTSIKNVVLPATHQSNHLPETSKAKAIKTRWVQIISSENKKTIDSMKNLSSSQVGTLQAKKQDEHLYLIEEKELEKIEKNSSYKHLIRSHYRKEINKKLDHLKAFHENVKSISATLFCLLGYSGFILAILGFCITQIPTLVGLIGTLIFMSDIFIFMPLFMIICFIIDMKTISLQNDLYKLKQKTNDIENKFNDEIKYRADFIINNLSLYLKSVHSQLSEWHFNKAIENHDIKVKLFFSIENIIK